MGNGNKQMQEFYPEDYVSPAEPADDMSGAIERCITDAAQHASERGGASVCFGTYTCRKTPVVILPDVPGALNLTIFGRDPEAGVYPAEPYLPAFSGLQVYGPLPGKAIRLTEPGHESDLEIALPNANTRLTVGQCIEIRAYIPDITPVPGALRMARQQINEVAGTNSIAVQLARPLDFPYDPAAGDCTLTPHSLAKNVTVRGLTFDPACLQARFGRLRGSQISNISGQILFDT